jgi:hypothetical protein
MKLALFLLSSFPLLAQTTNITVTFSLPTPVVADAITSAKSLTYVSFGSGPTVASTLMSAMGTSDTSFTITSATGYTATDVFANAGASLLIDNEIITCTSLIGTQYSGCSRAQLTTTQAAHSAGASVYQLRYATTASLLKHFLTLGIQQLETSLGCAATYLATNCNAAATANAAITTSTQEGTILK